MRVGVWRWAKGTKKEGRGVFLEQSDVRIKKMARKAGSLIIFVVDASGSMALNRMNAAKGAAMSLLTEAYQSQDQISLIPFQGDMADVLLPPTKSIAMAKRRLESMPCGGGSPLADAIQTATMTGLNAQKCGDVGKVVVVCISDGRANVPLCVSRGEEFDPDVDEDSKDGKPSRKYPSASPAAKNSTRTLMRTLRTESPAVSTSRERSSPVPSSLGLFQGSTCCASTRRTSLFPRGLR